MNIIRRWLVGRENDALRAKLAQETEAAKKWYEAAVDLERRKEELEPLSIRNADLQDELRKAEPYRQTCVALRRKLNDADIARSAAVGIALMERATRQRQAYRARRALWSPRWRQVSRPGASGMRQNWR